MNLCSLSYKSHCRSVRHYVSEFESGTHWLWHHLCNHCGGSANILHKCYSDISPDKRCAVCVVLRGDEKEWFLFFLYFRALASSAPIWQFPGMVPCGDFYKIVTQDFAKSGPNCDANIRKSWKAINNVSSTGMPCSHNGLIYLICYTVGKMNEWIELFRMIN